VLGPRSYTTDSLHSAVVEIVCKKSSRVTYTTIQNWSNNVYNLVTKRAYCDAKPTWSGSDGNIGSRLTIKYPAVYPDGPQGLRRACLRSPIRRRPAQDAGAKMVHAAPETTSTIISSLVLRSRRTSYRAGPFRRRGQHSKSFVALRRPPARRESRSDTYPYIEFGGARRPGGPRGHISRSAMTSSLLMSRALRHRP